MEAQASQTHDSQTRDVNVLRGTRLIELRSVVLQLSVLGIRVLYKTCMESKITWNKSAQQNKILPSFQQNKEIILTFLGFCWPFRLFQHFLGVSGLDISARPLAQASVKTVGRVQITDHSPVLASTIFDLFYFPL